MPLPIPPLQLPSVDSVLSNFKSSFPAEPLDRIASILTKPIEAIRRDYESSYRALYSPTQSQDQKAYKLRCAYEMLYQRTVVSHIRNLISSANQKIARPHPETRDPAEPKPKLRTRFRQEYVSFLEQYFQSNAYPSNTERAYLARETKMSDRQIEVWVGRWFT
ncbi:hypothetical protein AX14_009071 [Amanita brunnescens Koide BX004]|nr:hypothetical protein AX14_009071 [Amanita brunnescens Koide BX004]